MFSRIVIRLLILFSFISAVGLYFFKPSPTKPEDKYVNVYCWYGLIDQSTIDEFKKETGITVRLDSYDNNEVLEAKLLASNSGFDIVFPSASPYVAWQIQAQVYQPLNKFLLPNFSNLDPTIVNFMNDIDEGLEFSIPYFWGTVGIAYNADTLKTILGEDIPKDLSLLFDLPTVEKIAPYGISLLEESIDVIPFALTQIGKSPNSDDENDLKQAANYLMKIRPFIKRFTSTKVVNDLVLGDTAVALTWSGEAQQAIKEAKEQGKNIEFFIPSNGSLVWIDAIAIPVGAPHPKNAHAFINFLLQPHIAARICKNSLHAVAVKKISDHLPQDINNNQGIFPSAELLKKLFMNAPPKTKQQLQLESEKTRMWAKIRLNEY